MEFKFDYEKALTRCRMLSSYEAAEMEDANGESRYLETRITLQDGPLMREYFNTAALVIGESCARAVVDASYGTGGFTWTLRLDWQRWNSERDLRRYVGEALTSYAMSQWLLKKGCDARSGVYKAVWDDMLGRCVSVMFRLRAPAKRRRTPFISPDSIMATRPYVDNTEAESLSVSPEHVDFGTGTEPVRVRVSVCPDTLEYTIKIESDNEE